jgi:oligopeptidase A
MKDETNPLLDFSGLPRFAEIKAENVGAAIETLLAESRAVVESITREEVPAAWDAFVRPLEDSTERLSRAWGQVEHLHAVLDSPELRSAYNASLPRITQFWTELGQSQKLFEKYRELKGSASFPSLAPARRKLVENALRDFRLGGAELAAELKPRYAAIQDELASLSAKFSENVLDATNAYSIFIEKEARLAGLPGDVLQAALEAAQKDSRPGWKFNLQMPSYLPVMQYADDRGLRETLYRANATRASEFGKQEWDNTPLIGRILKLRKEDAALLGYSSFAEVSLVPKMAQTPKEVLEFLHDLARRARPFAEKDLAQMREFAAHSLGLASLEAWDMAYASEKLRAERYAFSDQEVKQYFPEPQVVAGMFKLVERLYGIRIAESGAPVWHEDVRFYDIRNSSGDLIGQFYVDLYARETKRGGAWMDGAITRRRTNGAIQTPVAYLNCNFSGPVGGKPALFTHDDVITLFHEFGHGLHHLLTQIEDLGVSGINGVEWDAVELPSQFMENFCWEWEVLEHMTSHVDTKERLPRALFDKMLAAKNFQSGLAMLRQIEFSLFDMLLHFDFDPEGGRSAQDVLDAVRNDIAVIAPPAYNRFPNNFSHIFAGGYAAGYYSYKWAEVLSADAFSAFEEARDRHSVLDGTTGARFRDEVLAVGGSRPAAESFRAFRGRDPQVDALLRHNGMIPA